MAYSQDLFDCPICLQLLEDPVTTACGHSYCLKCINTFWDTKINRRGVYSCPHCRQTFNTRPVLKRNTILTDLLEQRRRTTGQSDATDDNDDGDTDAASGDVQCDACTGKTSKAVMFCVVCLASYCETHLQPHFQVPPLKKHNLIPATTRIKESLCGRHDKLLEVYCHTDQQFLCVICALDEHKGHDTVAVTTQKCEMQRQLERTRQEIADRVKISERKMAELRAAEDAIRDAAWEACDDFERMCEEHIPLYIRSLKRKCSEMREKVGQAEKAGVDWTKSHLGQLQREVSELRRREQELCQLSVTNDPLQFIQGFQALGDLTVFPDSHERLDTLPEVVAAKKHELKNVCNKEKNELFIKFLHSEGVLMSKRPRLQEERPSRTNLLTRYSEVKVDPNTITACLCLSDTKKEISCSARDQAHPDHPDRFTYFQQALCEKGLQGDHYWEVEWDGGVVEVAVSYKGIKRKGSGKDCCFGHNDLSWKLACSPFGCTFWHNSVYKGRIPPAQSRRVGVRLDYKEGKLCFYSVSDPDSLTLLHQIQTTFTEPLYPGFTVDLGTTLKIRNI